MNDKPASESPEVVTSKGIGSSALLASVSSFFSLLNSPFTHVPKDIICSDTIQGESEDVLVAANEIKRLKRIESAAKACADEWAKEGKVNKAFPWVESCEERLVDALANASGQE